MSRNAVSISIGLSLALTTLVRADFIPIPLTAGSFNQDIVVEKGAPFLQVNAATASMDNGLANTGFGWYEQGYNPDAPDTGLPLAGSTVTSESLPDHSYRFAASYTNNNALLVDGSTNGVLTLAPAAAFSGLSFLNSAGHGPVTVNYTLTHQDGSTEKGTFTAPDWFGGTNQAVTANGRVDFGTLALGNVSSGDPRLYSTDITVTNSANPVVSVSFSQTNTTTHAAIFAVSGSTGAGFNPVTVTGYNVDMIFEATAPHLLTGLNATTASMDNGLGNTGASWYERGYNTNTNALSTGLPVAGSTITNTTGSLHAYTFPTSYTNNNALLIDASSSSGTLTAVTPAAFVGLSFLTSAGGGQVLIDYTAHHVDGSTEAGTLTSPDWFNNVPIALTTSGRVDVVTGSLDAVNTTNPRLYSQDILLTNSTSPVASVDLAYNSGSGHAVIFALSGSAGGVAPIINTQPASAGNFTGASAQLSALVSGTDPLHFQWQRAITGGYTNVTDAGTVSGSTSNVLSFSNLAMTNAGNYILIASNAFGSSTSLVATVTVLSQLTDITTPGDEITAVGGSSPAAEQVANAIDNTTQKYLNFGTDGDQVAPFAGPVGFVVTPSQGVDVAGTIVTGLRLFTANDAAERDPAGYTLEGAGAGSTNFVSIASGTITLPDTRNAAALDLDPLTQGVQEVLFTNNVPYKSYRLLFTSVRNPATANSVQIGEIELLGTVATSGGGGGATLSISQGTGGSLTLTSSAPGTLQSTTTLSDNTTWQDEGTINGSMTVTPTGTAKFYRVVAQ